MIKSILPTENKLSSTVAQQLAEAASAFEERLTGHAPKSVTVVLSDTTLVITLHGALSPAERALAQTPGGANRVQEFHRELFANSFDWLRKEIKRITGVEVREATAEVEAESGTVVKAFTTGTVVQVFLLAGSVPAGTWSGVGSGHSLEREPIDGRKHLGGIESGGKPRSL
ncbi:MAG: Na-translocating system protein MpsC family protein [Pirellulales bacterium]